MNQNLKNLLFNEKNILELEYGLNQSLKYLFIQLIILKEYTTFTDQNMLYLLNFKRSTLNVRWIIYYRNVIINPFRFIN